MSQHRIRLSALTPAPSAQGAAAETSPFRLNLLASLNHEIRTPLSGILGMADLLLESRLDQEQREYVGAVRECAGILFGLLNDTLEYTSLASGHVRLEEAEFLLEDTLRTAVDETEPLAAAKGVQLHAALSPDLPHTAVGDAYRVRQVMILLAQHALRTCDSGLLRLAARVLFHPGRRFYLCLSVQSSSRAFSPQEASRILDAFDQIECGANRRFNGVGLGLALIRRVVRLLGGDVIIEQDAGGSIQLTAEIPLRLPAPVLVSNELPDSQAWAAAEPRLLIVEDNRISQQVLSAMLLKGAFQFDCADDGPSAIAAAAACPYSLILMDLQMPGMDGFETTARIRSLAGYQNVPILALTAEVSDQVRSLCRQCGMAAFLNKPIQAAELLSAVRRYLNP